MRLDKCDQIEEACQDTECEKFGMDGSERRPELRQFYEPVDGGCTRHEVRQEPDDGRDRLARPGEACNHEQGEPDRSQNKLHPDWPSKDARYHKAKACN